MRFANLKMITFRDSTSKIHSIKQNKTVGNFDKLAIFATLTHSS